MKNNKNVPQLRFEGFTEDWEQRKVSDVSEIVAGGTPSTAIKKYWEPKQISWLSSGEVHKKNITYTDDKISKEGLIHSSARIVKENSVLIALAGQGKTRGTVAINRIPLSTNQSIASMTFDKEIYPEFVFSNLENRYDEIRKISSGDGSRGGLNKQLIGEIEIPCTSFEEQKNIGNYFKEIDHLIALHQSKYEKLLDLKKSMLYKLFPKEGETVPEIRFGGVTDNWDKKRLGECFSERTESFPEGELLSVTINSGIKKFSELERKNNSNENKSKYKKVYVGDIAYNSMRMWQGASGYSPYEGIVSPAYTVLSPKDGIDSKCFSYLFKRTDIIHMFQIYSKGITSDNWNLKYPDFKELEVCVPQDYEEQRAIGEYFSKLDHVIDLNKEKLEKLKNIKTSLLDKMFV